ncbi:MAG: ABC transporter ATP-binding protein [Ignavibacteriales bacterium]|nr:ABC transporter ATP-binding protein [Ignavibacteriales bacterium]MCF8306640.1 ABC transporter ATP-binding protein [Ignavibacteriales bacterium]MCF8316260.1 ABC transporter ATP-binding protein [Ignavibacteriales bacterium]MCF8437844.1 ABC transporter ATP-binding protein [Ignavibacteriales bacterium]
MIIAVDGLVKSYKDVQAVRDISFSVRKGEMFGFVGPDGAGKTTVIRILCGLVMPNEGEISILDFDLKINRQEIQKKIGYLSQKFSLYGDLTVDENIEFFAEIHNVRNYHSRREELLEFTRLTPFRDRLADKLSGGMKQKLALACSLIHKPAIIFLDEPTTGVDPVSRRDFWKILAKLLKEEITIIMSTPYLDEAERCHRVALFNNGKIIALDSPDTLKKGTGMSVLEIVSFQARKGYSVINSKTSHSVQLFGDRINVMLPLDTDPQTILNILRDDNIIIEDSRLTSPNLENVFIYNIQGKTK